MRREDWDQRYAEAEALWTLLPNRFLVDEASSLPPGRALDLACGEGRNAIWLATLGWDVTGVDFSSVAIEKARARADRDNLGAAFHCADLLEYEPELGAYDLVLVFYLQVPAAERLIVLERAGVALAPGGILLVVGHHLDNLTEGVGGPSDPDRLYTPDDIVAQLPGLQIEKAERVLRDIPDADRPAIDALVRARKPSG